MKIEKPQGFSSVNKPKAVIFGAEGSGKSTLASKLQKVLFINVEDGIAGLDVDSVKISSWSEFVTLIKEIAKETIGSESFPYHHIAIDSLTALERLLHQHICSQSGSSSIVLACGGYGKGLVESVTQMSLLMNNLLSKKDLGVWFLCHSAVKSVNDPTRGEYASFVVRADKAMAEWVTSWADLVGFIEIDLMVSDDGKPVIKKEGNEVRRTITVTPRSGLTAKSRIPGLSGVMNVDNFVSKVNEIFSQKASK
ncbi:MAG: hypothetical protein EBR30_10685 [Cytophagia bacterium]|jgi:GTPase SAR1 family protein|nr:hypothetical protein [Cytophagia bacterium]